MIIYVLICMYRKCFFLMLRRQIPTISAWWLGDPLPGGVCPLICGPLGHSLGLCWTALHGEPGEMAPELAWNHPFVPIKMLTISINFCTFICMLVYIFLGYLEGLGRNETKMKPRKMDKWLTSMHPFRGRCLSPLWSNQTRCQGVGNSSVMFPQ